MRARGGREAGGGRRGGEGRGTRDESGLATIARLDIAPLVTGAAYGTVLWSLGWAFGLSYVTGISPAVLLPGFLVFGAVCWWAGLRRIVWTLTGVGALVLAVVALTPIMRRPVHALIRSDPLPAHVDAVVVLHGGTNQDGLVGPVTLDRVLGGVALLRHGIATTVIITEPHSRVSSEGDERRILTLAPPGVRVLAVRDAYTTHDEALKTAALARAMGGRIHSIALATSPTHTRRACATFEKVGFVVTCVPVPDRVIAVWTLREVGDRILGFHEWIYETLGTVKYRWEGWI